MSGSLLAHALELAGYGFHVFQVAGGAKKPPRQKNWQARATVDRTAIERAWAEHPTANIGISTSAFGTDGYSLVAIDVDTKGGKNGEQELTRLDIEGFVLPPTFEQRTPSGGRHLIYKTRTPVRQGTNVLGPGVDIRAQGGYLVGAGSITDTGRYEVANSAPVADAPHWLVEKCGAAQPTRERAPSPVPNVDAEQAAKRAIEYLEQAPAAIEGEGGDHATFATAARVKDLGCSETVCVDLMAEYWNPRCVPLWPFDELQRKVANAYAYGKESPGSKAPEAVFSSVPVQEQPKPDVPAWVAEMNDRYFVVNESGKVLVYRLANDPALRREVLERFSFEDLKRLYMNDRVPAGRKVVNRAEAWLEHAARRQYRGGVTFAPGEKVAPDVFNLWRGFSIQPKAGDWPLLQAHIRDVICAGDELSYRYVLGWLARLVQRPGDQGQVALVLRGGRGVGKGALGNLLLRIFGQHGLYITHAKHLVGSFNAHLRDAVLVFADEAFYAGDRQHEGVLKGLVTDPFITIEGKHQNVVTARNVTHLLLASNEQWVVPAGADERRFCVLDVSDKHQQDHSYFKKLHEEINAGGLAAMLTALLEYDRAAFDVFAVPQTKALLDQKLHSLRGPEAWLLDCLQDGAIGIYQWQAKGLEIRVDEAYGDYVKFSQQQNAYKPTERRAWAKAIRKVLGPAISTTRPGNEERARCYAFRSPAECRAAFARHVKAPGMDWEFEESGNEGADDARFG